MDTPAGVIIAEICTDRAPLSSQNFLRYVDKGLYRNAAFYRAARPENDEREPKIRVIQGGIDSTCRNAPLPPVAHESTRVTGLTHVDGALAAVRWEPGTASSEFFIVVGETPELDHGGARCPDGEGFAVFGRVLEGMPVVRRINAERTGTTSLIPFMRNQSLLQPVPLRISRVLARAEISGAEQHE
jgi:peptidyl-prolyl cis-trans isomerase A (cyclophilin A)